MSCRANAAADGGTRATVQSVLVTSVPRAKVFLLACMSVLFCRQARVPWAPERTGNPGPKVCCSPEACQLTGEEKKQVAAVLTSHGRERAQHHHRHQAGSIHDGDRLISRVGTFPPSDLRVLFPFPPTFLPAPACYTPRPSRQLTNYLPNPIHLLLFSDALQSRPAPATRSHTQPGSRARLPPRP